jgi:energy-coupling factor transport system permease protein
MMLLVSLFYFNHPLFTGVCLAGMFFLSIACAGRQKTWAPFRFILPMGIIFCLLNLLLVRRGETILFYIFYSPVTLEAALFGIYNMAVLFCVLLLFIAFNGVIDQPAFLYISARFVPKTAFVLSLALSSVSRFKDRAQSLSGIQQTRGLDMKNGPLRTRAAAALTLFGAMAIRSLEEGMETAEVLKARDYGVNKRTHYRAYRFRRRDAIGLTVFIFLFSAAIALYSYFQIKFLFYPRVSALHLGARELSAGAVYTAFVISPQGYQIFMYGFARRKARRVRNV